MCAVVIWCLHRPCPLKPAVWLSPVLCGWASSHLTCRGLDSTFPTSYILLPLIGMTIIQGIVCFGFCCYCPVLFCFSLHWAACEAILIFKYNLWLWRCYDVCLIVVCTGFLLCVILNMLNINQCCVFQVVCPTERSSPPHQERWMQTSQPSQKAILNQATRVEERGERKTTFVKNFKIKPFKIKPIM